MRELLLRNTYSENKNSRRLCMSLFEDIPNQSSRLLKKLWWHQSKVNVDVYLISQKLHHFNGNFQLFDLRLHHKPMELCTRFHHKKLPDDAPYLSPVHRTAGLGKMTHQIIGETSWIRSTRRESSKKKWPFAWRFTKVYRNRWHIAYSR